jgi:ubiquinone/menaquinone biosynthesis C-methylase UbiE
MAMGHAVVCPIAFSKIDRRIFMDKPMPSFAFKFMQWIFKVRDRYRSRRDILSTVPIQPGHQVLDFGCGPGSYTRLAAIEVGPSGRVFALDIHPLAIETVKKMAAQESLDNIQTICSDGPTGLKKDSIDVILLYDIFHMLGEPEQVLQELHRVLKPTGFLSFSDHHMKEAVIVSRITQNGMFRLAKKEKWTHTFVKQ